MSLNAKFVFKATCRPGCIPLLNWNNSATNNEEKFGENIAGFY